MYKRIYKNSSACNVDCVIEAARQLEQANNVQVLLYRWPATDFEKEKWFCLMCDFEIKLELDTSIESVKQRIDEAMERRKKALAQSGNDQPIQ